MCCVYSSFKNREFILVVFFFCLKKKVTILACLLDMSFWWVCIIYRDVFQLLNPIFLNLIWDLVLISLCCLFVKLILHELSEGGKVESTLPNFSSVFSCNVPLPTAPTLSFVSIHQLLIPLPEVPPQCGALSWTRALPDSFKNSRELDFSRPVIPCWRRLRLTHCWTGQRAFSSRCCSWNLPLSSPLHTHWLLWRSPLLRSGRHHFASRCFLMHRCWDHVDSVTVGDLVLRGLWGNVVI